MWASAILALTLQAAPQEQDLATVAASDGRFETLVAAVQAAGLLGALSEGGPWTVLAPTDDAFERLPEGLVAQLLLPQNKDALVSLLTGHLIEGASSAVDLFAAREATTAAGTKVTVALRDGRLVLGGAPVVLNDVAASNGVIHVIDQVLVPDGFTRASPPTSPASQLIERAIERGAPLFNAGQVVACAAVYDMTVTALLLLEAEPALDEGQRSVLETAWDAANEQHDAGERAWVLRRAMDAVWRSMQVEAQTAIVSKEPAMTRTLFDFDAEEFASESAWRSVNDNVMGGISKGGLEDAGDSVGAFTGALSLANNGGFSTVRSSAADLDLGAFAGLEMRVRGDGRTYSVRAMRSDRRGEVRNWRASFETESGTWQTIRVPFSAMQMSVMGRQFPNSAPDPADIRSIGFSISDKNESPFRLEIDWIRAYRDPIVSTR